MITMMGSIPYPPMADAAPILALAADLKLMAGGLGQGSSRLTGTASTAQSSWVGQAATAFLDTMAKRSATIDQVAQFIGGAAVPLQTFGAAIQTTSAAYSAAAVAERAAEAGMPWTFAALAAALAEEAAAVIALEAAGVACAAALVVIEAKVAAAEYGLAHLGHGTSATPTPTPPAASPTPVQVQVPTAPTPAPVTPAPVAPPAAATTAGAELAHVLEELVGALHHGLTVADSEFDGFVKGMKTALERNLATYTRNGAVLERWAASRGGPATGLTYRQATAAAETAGRWGERVAAVGLVVDGVHQVMEDNHDVSLTTSQRVARTSAAVGVQGGLTIGGAEAGATVGAEIGALVGALFGGVGAVPGALVGGFIGGVAGGYAGSVAGKAAKEQLFESNPGGAFR